MLFNPNSHDSDINIQLDISKISGSPNEYVKTGFVCDKSLGI